MDIKKISINKLLEEDLYLRKSISLKKLLESNPSRNIIMRIYRKQKDSFYKQALINKENSNKKNNRYNNNFSKSQNIIDLNESIIQLFHKTYYLQNKAKKNFEQKKETNDIFEKRLNNMKKFEKEREKFEKKASNSAIKFNQSFDIFKDVIKKYKERDGILYKKDLFKKDVFKETPIVANDQDNINKFYVYNYNKYAKKTHLHDDIDEPKPKKKSKKNKKKNLKDNIDKHKQEKNSKINQKPNEIKNINFDNLTVTNFYKKLFFILQEKIYHMQDKEFNPEKFKYHLRNDEDEEKRNISEIPKLKKDIKVLNSLYNMIQNKKIKNLNNKLLEKYNTPNNSSRSIFKKKFLIQKPNEKIVDLSNEFPSSKKSTIREIKYPTKIFQIHNHRNINLFSAKSKEDTDNKNNTRKLFDTPSFSGTQKNFFKRNKYREEKSVMSQKTKTTFYSIKNKKDKIYPLTARSKIKNSIDFKNEEINQSKDAYEELKSVSLTNKDLVLDKVEQYLVSKGYNVERIKKSVKKEQLFNFFNRMRNLIDNYHCKPKVSELYSNIGQKLSDNTFMNLNEINQMDKEIYSAEFYYYLSLFKC